MDRLSIYRVVGPFFSLSKEMAGTRLRSLSSSSYASGLSYTCSQALPHDWIRRHEADCCTRTADHEPPEAIRVLAMNSDQSWTFAPDGDPTGKAQAGLAQFPTTKTGDTLQVTINR